MKCRLCGMEKDNRRAMHGHLMFNHRAEYSAAGYLLDRLVEDAPQRKKEALKEKYAREKKLLKKPDGFRLLNSEDKAEAEAIKAGFTYVDNEDNLYTTADAKAENWI